MFQPLDTGLLLARLDGDEDLARELAAMLAQDAADLSARCRAYLAAGDLIAAREAAHTLKGAAANVCATEVARAASGLDDALRTSDLSRAQERLDDLTAAVAAAVPALERFANMGAHA